MCRKSSQCLFSFKEQPIRFRYPDDLFSPEKKDVDQAIISTEKVYDFVESKISDLEKGQLDIFDSK
jgi:hypothetical protein